MTVQDVTLRVVTLVDGERFEVPIGSIVQAVSNVNKITVSLSPESGEQTESSGKVTPDATTATTEDFMIEGGVGGGYFLFFDGSYLPQPPPSPEAP